MTANAHSDDELIDAIYATLVGEISWTALLETIARPLPEGKATLHLSDTSQNYQPFILSTGIEASTMDSFVNHYGALNPLRFNCDIRKTGEGVLLEEVIPFEKFSRTEYYNGFMKPISANSIMGVTIEREDFEDNAHCAFILSVLTARNDIDLNRPYARQLIRIAPHLQRAARFYRKGLFQQNFADIGATLLDAIDIGYAICGDYGHVKFISRTGQAFAKSGKPLGIGINGRLRLSLPKAMQCFEQMLTRQYDGAKVASFIHEQTRLTLIRVNKDPISLFFEGPTVLVLVEGPQQGDGVLHDYQYFSLAYRLSDAETRVLRSIAEGHSVTVIAARHQRSPETIRSQVKSIYAKTGVRNRVELINLMQPARLATASIHAGAVPLSLRL